MQTARDLFVHELSDMLDAEQRILEALSENEQEAGRPELQKAFAAHRKQTEQQVGRIEEVFQEFGIEPESTECKGIIGLIEEKRVFKEEDPSEDLLEIYTVGGAVKIERYEISMYESLVRLARELGLRDAAKLLGQSLAEEEATLKKMQAFEKKLKPSETGMEEQEEQIEEEERTTRRVPARPARGRRRTAA